MNKIFDCLINKNSSYIPIWFMRQAGRYLPEFMNIRKSNKDFIKLCLTPNLMEEITLQPLKRFDLDAAIIFSDILMIPYGLDQEVEFIKGEGPKLSSLDLNKTIKIKINSFTTRLAPIYKGIRLIKEKLNNKALIGFVGAPWTLLVYMLNQKSPKKNFVAEKIVKNKIITKELIDKITEFTCIHIDKQIEAGVNVIQIFDSWAGLIPQESLEEYCYQPTLKLVEHVKKKKVPVICFPKGIGKNYENFCSIVNPNCISIDYEIDPKWIKEKHKGIPVQGGLDPKILLTDKANIKKGVERYLKTFSNIPYIFNLGHGVTPQTNPETIAYVIKIVKGYSK